MNFEMTFDGRNSNFPKTREEAIARVREYARRKGVHIPEGAEPMVSDVVAWGRSNGLTVLFEWSEDPG